jgi:CheY-like chemotaxis protein
MSTLLIVDDDQDICACLKEMFLTHGYKILLASNGQAALRVLQKIHVDLILTDIDMPIMNGIEFIKEFRRKDKRTAIVVMSGGYKYTEQEILNFGATYFVRKPLTEIDDLLRRAIAA